MSEQKMKPFYDFATQRLLDIINAEPISKIDKARIKKAVMTLRESFLLLDVYKSVFPDMVRKEPFAVYPSDTYCDTACDALYMTTGGDQMWDMLRINNYIWNQRNGAHTYLRFKKTGTILDITYDQFAFYNITIPYSDQDIAWQPRSKVNFGELTRSELLLRASGITIPDDASPSRIYLKSVEKHH